MWANSERVHFEYYKRFFNTITKQYVEQKFFVSYRY